ncbi:MAG: riboflavin synthase subunit alpha [Neisseriaceae bacterium]|nr:riboflavin synthase subunit alpha [Neisseriaceae bacterium]MBR3425299.1 riboflavin synthase subunit alpha [Neisseriaceae bacterium]
MFSGIVQGMGEVVAIDDLKNVRRISVRLPKKASKNLTIGASIANNGCCLTITNINNDTVSFDLMAETLAKTNLGYLKVGDPVNIERALKVGDEIGGHLMSGHIITTVAIIRIQNTKSHYTVWFRLPENLHKYILPKGFVGLDGCSLTVGEVRQNEFCVHLIPETLQRSLFGMREVGDFVNLEIDAQTQAIVDTVEKVLQDKGFQAA